MAVSGFSIEGIRVGYGYWQATARAEGIEVTSKPFLDPEKAARESVIDLFTEIRRQEDTKRLG